MFALDNTSICLFCASCVYFIMCSFWFSVSIQLLIQTRQILKCSESPKLTKSIESHRKSVHIFFWSEQFRHDSSIEQFVYVAALVVNTSTTRLKYRPTVDTGRIYCSVWHNCYLCVMHLCQTMEIISAVTR